MSNKYKQFNVGIEFIETYDIINLALVSKVNNDMAAYLDAKPGKLAYQSNAVPDTDIPAGRIRYYDATGTGQIQTLATWEDLLAQDFLGLTDTPEDYTGASLKLVRVNTGSEGNGTGLEFVDASTVGNSKWSAETGYITPISVPGSLSVKIGDGGAPSGIFEVQKVTSTGSYDNIFLVHDHYISAMVSDASGSADLIINPSNLTISVNDSSLVINELAITSANLISLLASGTAAAPTYSFQADTDLGIYRESADTLGFSTGDNLALKLGKDAADFYTATNDNNAFAFTFNKKRGASGAVTDNTELMNISAKGYTTSAYREGAFIKAVAKNTFSASIGSTELQFGTTSGNTSAVRMTIEHAGKVVVGTSTTAGVLFKSHGYIETNMQAASASKPFVYYDGTELKSRTAANVLLDLNVFANVMLEEGDMIKAEAGGVPKNHVRYKASSTFPGVLTSLQTDAGDPGASSVTWMVRENVSFLSVFPAENNPAGLDTWVEYLAVEYPSLSIAAGDNIIEGFAKLQLKIAEVEQIAISGVNWRPPIATIFDSDSTSLAATIAAAGENDLEIDGYTVVHNDRILVIDSTVSGEIGIIYKLTWVTDEWVMTAVLDTVQGVIREDADPESGDTVFVYYGDTFALSTYYFNGTEWVKISQIPAVTGSNGISVDANNVTWDLYKVAGLSVLGTISYGDGSTQSTGAITSANAANKFLYTYDDSGTIKLKWDDISLSQLPANVSGYYSKELDPAQDSAQISAAAHGCGAKPFVSVWYKVDMGEDPDYYEEVEVYKRITASNDVYIEANSNFPADSYIVITGSPNFVHVELE